MKISLNRLPDGLGHKLWIARAVIITERLSHSFHWLGIWTLAFGILALFGIAYDSLSVIFWLGFVALLGFGFKKFRLPSESEVHARLEFESRILHRPLRSIEDEPASNLSRRSGELWEAEIRRKRHQLTLLRWAYPVFNVLTRDPYALRIAIILLLVAGVVVSGPALSGRLQLAFFPFSVDKVALAEQQQKIVITPPPYTRVPQIILTEKPAEPVRVPQGSAIRVLMQSWAGHLSLDAGDLHVSLKQDGKTNIYTAEADLPATEEIKIRQFGFIPRITIPLSYIEDQPPSVSLREKPDVIRGGQLRLPLTVQDDYGLKLIRVRAILSASVKSHPLGNPVYEEQSIIVSSDGKPVDINPTFDLTGHPWAGQKVSLLVEGEDHAGQAAQAEPVEVVLPERNFRHPVAKQIIAARKLLIRNGELAAGAVALELARTHVRPQNYEWDSVVTLALQSSISRLSYTPNRKVTEEVIATLWPTALRLEDGNLSTSQKDLRKALENLQRAMQEKRPPEEIAQLMEEFRDALANYLMTLQKEVQKKAAQGELMPISPDMMVQSFDPSMLGDFLNQLENEMINGDIQSAMEKLENLQKLTDMLDPAMAQPMPEDIKKMMQMMKDLQQVIDQQQGLLDKTRAKKSGENSQGEQATQSGIQGDLGKVSAEIQGMGGETPEGFGKAGESMKGSAEKLGANQPEGSIPHQQEALDQLRQGKKQMQQAMQKKMQQMMGLSFGAMPQSPDPLGRNRPNNGKNIFNDDVKIPSEAERKKADEILKTIRERSSDLGRPQQEREYYQRLLRQW